MSGKGGVLMLPITTKGKSWLDQTSKLDDQKAEICNPDCKTVESKRRWFPEMGKVTLVVFISVIVFIILMIMLKRFL